MITVLVADDQTIFRDGIATLISENEGLTVIGKASNGLAAVELYEDNDNYDVVVMDYRMPVLNGLQAMRKILEYDPEAKIIMLSMYDDKEYVLEAFLSGAKAVISKNDDTDKLIEAIYDVVEGKHYLLDGQAGLLIETLRNTNYPSGLDNPFDKPSGNLLTEAEINVLRLLAREFTSQEIADELGISARTVEAHRRNMMTKTGKKNIAGLMMYGIENGLINRFVLRRN
jgi:DNA-binding NarL/FixJ family response regulator